LQLRDVPHPNPNRNLTMTKLPDSTNLADAQFDLELAKARHMAQAMTLVMDALMTPRPSYEVDVHCPKCLKVSLRHTPNPAAQGYTEEVCADCAKGDEVQFPMSSQGVW